MSKGNVIAAVRTNDELIKAAKSSVPIIFMLCPNISLIKEQAKTVHDANKKIFIHLDLAEGIGKDEFGILYAKECGVDGIISTRSNIIKLAKNHKLFAVQRFFIVDSHSVDTIIETSKNSKADMIEVMPGVVPKVIKKLKSELNMPIVAGGIIDCEREILEAIQSGATAVSIGKEEFWG
ncbi:MAG: glycerol-3-phosphate responsive antiterminator [Clostridia bacterium]|nr:glycerol-3-phosphate responsive antiterminator [Clostridia bacterium]